MLIRKKNMGDTQSSVRLVEVIDYETNTLHLVDSSGKSKEEALDKNLLKRHCIFYAASGDYKEAKRFSETHISPEEIQRRNDFLKKSYFDEIIYRASPRFKPPVKASDKPWVTRTVLPLAAAALFGLAAWTLYKIIDDPVKYEKVRYVSAVHEDMKEIKAEKLERLEKGLKETENLLESQRVKKEERYQNLLYTGNSLFILAPDHDDFFNLGIDQLKYYVRLDGSVETDRYIGGIVIRAIYDLMFNDPDSLEPVEEKNHILLNIPVDAVPTKHPVLFLRESPGFFKVVLSPELAGEYRALDNAAEDVLKSEIEIHLIKEDIELFKRFRP